MTPRKRNQVMKSLTGNVQGFLSCVPMKKGKPLKDFQLGSGKVIFRKITLAVLCCVNQRGRDVEGFQVTSTFQVRDQGRLAEGRGGPCVSQAAMEAVTQNTPVAHILHRHLGNTAEPHT